MEQGTIVVGVDDSPQSRAAVRWAADQARAAGCRLVGLHVLEWPPATDVYGYAVLADQVLGDGSGLDDAYRAPSQAVFDEVEPEPGWTLRFAHGHAGHILVDEARDARMLVLGAREHTGVMRLLHGSTGHYCLNHTRCPLVAVPCGSVGRHRAGGTTAGAAGR